MLEAAKDEHDGRVAKLAATIFVQMLPATMVVAAIRPLFALLHSGHEGALHAFMSVNMAGAVVSAPLIGLFLDRAGSARSLFRFFAFSDALLLASVILPWPTELILILRTLEGAAHVGATTILLSEASAIARLRGEGRTMGIAGAAIVFAIAAGNGLGAFFVALGPRVPFVIGAVLSFLVAWFDGGVPLHRDPGVPDRSREGVRWPWFLRMSIIVPALSAFVERFSVGCIIVTFALFAHRVHGLSDSRIGLLYFAMTSSFALAMYPSGRLSEYVPRAAVLSLGAWIYALPLLGLTYLGAGQFMLAMILAGTGAGMMFSSTLSYASLFSAPHRRGRVMALLNASGCLGMLAGPAVAGIVSATIGSSGGDPSERFRIVFSIAGASILVWFVLSSYWLFTRLEEEILAQRARRGLTPTEWVARSYRS